MRRLVPILAVVAVLLSLVAAWSIAARLASSARTRQGPMLPEVAALTHSVRFIELLQGDRTVRLERREGDRWVLSDRGGYPADPAAVRSLLSGLAQLDREEAKTRRPDRHRELNLAWPDPEGRARLVRLQADPETSPVEVILGQERITPRLTYVRRRDQDQTWRCRGGVNADVDLQRWMRRDLLSLPAQEVLEAAWSPARTPADLQSLQEWPTRLEFEDVRPATGEFQPDPPRTLVFGLRGAVLAMEGRDEGPETWFRIRVEPRPGGSPPTRDRVPGDPWIPDWQEFARSVTGWEYRLPSWRRSQLERMERGEPEPLPPAPANMDRRDRLPPPSIPG